MLLQQRRLCLKEGVDPHLFAHCVVYVMRLWSMPFYCVNGQKNVWFCCPLALRIDPVMISSFHSWCEEWMGKVFKGDELAGCMFAYGCWLIWKGRYEAVFEGGSIDPVVVGRRIFSAAVEFCNANGRISEINDVVAEEDCRWMPPENGQLKANIDGSFDKASMKAGVGVLIRDSEGCVVDG